MSETSSLFPLWTTELYCFFFFMVYYQLIKISLVWRQWHFDFSLLNVGSKGRKVLNSPVSLHIQKNTVKKLHVSQARFSWLILKVTSVIIWRDLLRSFNKFISSVGFSESMRKIKLKFARSVRPLTWKGMACSTLHEQQQKKICQLVFYMLFLCLNFQ